VLRLAIQKSGRLSQDSLNLLEECGIKLSSGRSGSRLKAPALNFPLEVVFLRDDDIPRYVEDGTAHIGIVGENVLREVGCKADIILPLGFSQCRLSIAVPRESEMQTVIDLEGKRIATSYSSTLREFLWSRKVNCSIHHISGSVEVAPSLGLADAICDIVGSGSTLVSNGLKEIELVLHSEAVLIGSPGITANSVVDGVGALLEKLLFRIRAVRNAVGMKYVVLNAPKVALDKIIALLPGIKSPTVVPLAEEEWCAVHSLVNESEFWDKLELLRDAGAEGILVVPIEKIIR
jgi:ATP phosphoribosyltransferase